MKPSILTMDYVALVQDGVMTINDVPQNLQSEVSKWSGYFLDGAETEAESNEPGSQTN